MKKRTDNIKAKKAMLELKAAYAHLGAIHLSSDLEGDEFFEICSILEGIGSQCKRIEVLIQKENKS